MKTKVYSYKNCSTCQKALKFLEGKKIAYELLDITETPPSQVELKDMLQSYSGTIKKLFNTSGQLYREMGLGNKLADLSDQQALDLLASNGKLIKRPFLLVNGKAKKVGFKEDEWTAALKI